MDLSALAFVERQEEWLRRKQTTLRAKTHEVERAVKNAATFNPNLAISQSSLRPAQVRYYCCCVRLANEAHKGQGCKKPTDYHGRTRSGKEESCSEANVCGINQYLQ